jgi:F-type H+-transporting ATPase subunit delta
MLSRTVRRAFGASARYSITLFRAAAEAKVLDQVSTDVTFLKQLYSDSTDFRVLVSDPTINARNLNSVFSDLSTQAQFSSVTLRLINVLVENKRLSELPSVLKEYEEHVRNLNRKETVKVVSASALTDTDRQDVANALKEYDGSVTYELSYEVDAALLGGVQLYFPTAFMDLSLRSRLNKIRDDVASIAS